MQEEETEATNKARSDWADKLDAGRSQTAGQWEWAKLAGAADGDLNRQSIELYWTTPRLA